MPKSIAIYLETGKRRTFACALDWPGWCRSGKTEENAVEALAAYRDRYAEVTKAAGLTLPSPPDGFEIIERLRGTAGHTDFGAPGEIAAADREPTTPDEAGRLAALISAA
jgi:hypothetical protein